MKPSLQFRLSQHLTLTPQLQQSIRLLQLSTVELNQEIERLLMENPALEREDEHDVPVKGASEGASEPAPSAPAESSGSEAADWPSEVATNWRGPDDDEEGDRTHATPDTPRPHARAALAHESRRARPRLRRDPDRRARRGRLPHAAPRGNRGAASARSRSERGRAEDRALPPAALRARRRRRALAGRVP